LIDNRYFAGTCLYPLSSLDHLCIFAMRPYLASTRSVDHTSPGAPSYSTGNLVFDDPSRCRYLNDRADLSTFHYYRSCSQSKYLFPRRIPSKPSVFITSIGDLFPKLQFGMLGQLYTSSLFCGNRSRRDSWMERRLVQRAMRSFRRAIGCPFR
jgi:hypothetical protein